MADPTLILYVDARRASPYAMSAFVALTEKQLPFELDTVKLSAGEQRRSEYRQRSLTGRVPTLVHDGFSLSESSAITEYLEEAFPAPRYAAIYPQGLRQRSRARQIQAWLRSDLMPIRMERTTDVVFFRVAGKPLSDEARSAVEALIFAAETLLPMGAENLFGDWCIADTELALMLNRLALNGDDLPDRLSAYAARQWLRPSVQRWISMERVNE